MTLVYATAARLPSEFAHALQIVENCAAFAAAGADVTLLAAQRREARTLVGAGDPRDHYGVGRGFRFERLPCLDLTGRDVGLPFRAAGATFAVSLVRRLRSMRRPDLVVYGRDPLVLTTTSLLLPGTTLVYEAHQEAATTKGAWLQRQCVRRAALVVAVTSHLEAHARRLGATRTLVAPSGVREARFAALPSRADARERVGVPADAFVVGYVGRLETLGLEKGVDAVVEAAALVDDVPLSFAVVGGPASGVAALRARWLGRGLPPDRFIAPGAVPPGEVPTWLAALDVATMTFPDTPHFSECASPLKLFEYLAAGLPIVASHLPSLSEVLRDGEQALLVAPAHAGQTAEAFARLYRDPRLRRRLSESARATAAQYSLSVRARRILDALAVTGSRGGG